MRKLFLLLIISFIFSATFGQETSFTPKGKFLMDTTKIGEHVQFALSFQYPQTTKVLFPDSAYNYFPFEFVSKEFFPTTISGEGILKDSVIYTVATFELDSVYYLSLPLFIFEGSDSLSYFSNSDSILLKPVVTKMPEKPELLADTSLQETPLQFNYIYFTIGAAVIVVLLVVLGLLFGRKIYRMFIIYRLKKSFEKFKTEYTQTLAQKETNQPIETAQHALFVWKKYLEKLDRKPITKLTTKEITRVYPDKNLHETLRTLDRSLYGGVQITNFKDVFVTLEDFSFERLNNKIEEVNNG